HVRRVSGADGAAGAAPTGPLRAGRARAGKRPRVMTKPILRLRNVTKRFRGLVATNDVSLDLAEGSISSLIGPNGAGKSTLFNLVTGYGPPDAAAAEMGFARLGWNGARHQIEHGRLAGAVRTDQAGDASLREIERDVVDGDQPAKTFGDVGQTQNRPGHDARPRRRSRKSRTKPTSPRGASNTMATSRMPVNIMCRSSSLPSTTCV